MLGDFKNQLWRNVDWHFEKAVESIRIFQLTPSGWVVFTWTWVNHRTLWDWFLLFKVGNEARPTMSNSLKYKACCKLWIPNPPYLAGLDVSLCTSSALITSYFLVLWFVWVISAYVISSKAGTVYCSPLYAQFLDTLSRLRWALSQCFNEWMNEISKLAHFLEFVY